MSSAEQPDIETSSTPPPRLSTVPTSRVLHDAPGPWPRIDPPGPLPPAGQPGHGRTTSLRRQSAWVASDRKGHRTGLFEIICRDCGDHPYLDYEAIPPRLQRIRGPYTLEAGLEAYAEHVGLPEATPGRSGTGEATMSPGPGDPDIATRPRSVARSSVVPAPRRPGDSGDLWLRLDAGSAVT